MRVGDLVWVQVSRDRQRGGTVTELGNAKHLVSYGQDCEEWVDKDKIITKDKAVKHDGDKNRLELIPVSGIEGIGRAMSFGAKKYAAHNWASGFAWSRLCGSALRHLLAWMSGQDKDPESGLSHLDHLGACVVMLIAHENERLGQDDRRKSC